VRKIILIIFVIALAAAVALSVLLFATTKNSKQEASSLKKQLKNYISKEPDKDIYNVLLLGYGGPGHPGGGLSDANIVVSINTTDKTVSLIAIPRDMWVEVPVRSDLNSNFKINAVYAIGNDDNRYPSKQSEFKGSHGGGNLAKYVFSQTLGIDIQHYMAIDFVRFQRAINALGGITVDVPVSFTDKYFPIPGNEELLCDFSPEKNAEVNETYSGFELEKQFECRYETLEFTKGQTQMNGETALKFIRSRHSENYGSDFARGERQQVVLQAIKQKLISLDAINNIDDFYTEFKHLVTTDINEQIILEILPKIGDVESYKIKKINITDQNFLHGTASSDGQSVLVPNAGLNNFSEIQKFIQANLEENLQ